MTAFDRGKSLHVYEHVFAFSATFCISKGKFCTFHFGASQIKKSKIRKFQNALKYDLNEL